MKQVPNPAQLWVGSQEQLNAKIISYLSKQLCQQSGDGSCLCRSCYAVSQQSHPKLLWLNPIKSYTVDDIDQILHKTQFLLEDNEQFYIVLENAQTLSLNCANRLLKTLEEPPCGYQFILLTSNKEAILPTIVSRCALQTMHCPSKQESYHPILTYFIDKHKQNDAIGFEKTLKEASVNDAQSSMLLDELYRHIHNAIKTLYKKELGSSTELSYLKKAYYCIMQNMKKPPQSGSSTLFWKNLYLSYPHRR